MDHRLVIRVSSHSLVFRGRNILELFFIILYLSHNLIYFYINLLCVLIIFVRLGHLSMNILLQDFYLSLIIFLGIGDKFIKLLDALIILF